MTLALRMVTLDDLSILTQLFVATFNTPPWNDGWSHDAASERLAALIQHVGFRGAICHWGAEPVGLLLGQAERWIADYHFNLMEMCVAPEHQRRGIGTALLTFMRLQLGQEAIHKLYLITAPNGPSEAFYLKNGFGHSRGRVVLTAGR